MKNRLIMIVVLFMSAACAMSTDTQLVPYFPAHVRMVRLVNGQDRTDDAQMPAFFYREVILAAYAHQPTPSEIAHLAEFYQKTHRLPDGAVRHDDGSVSSRAEFEQAIEKTIQEATAIQQQKQELVSHDQTRVVDQQIQEIAHEKDRVSRFLTATRTPFLIMGGAMSAAGIMYAAAQRSKTRFVSLSALTELPKAVYAVLVVGTYVFYKSKDIYRGIRMKMLEWSRNKALAAVDELRPRLDTLEKLEHDKDRELATLRSTLAAHQKADLEARTQQDQVVKSMVTALRVQLDKLTRQWMEETQTGESAHQQLRQELTDMQESLGNLRVSGQHQAETLIQIQKACAQVEAIAGKLKKR